MQKAERGEGDMSYDAYNQAIKIMTDKLMARYNIPFRIKEDIASEVATIFYNKPYVGEGYLINTIRNKVYKFFVRVMRERYYCGLPSNYLVWKQRRAEKNRLYKKCHRAEINISKREYYRKHREIIIEKAKKYSQMDHIKERHKIYCKTYRAKRKAREME